MCAIVGVVAEVKLLFKSGKKYKHCQFRVLKAILIVYDQLPDAKK